MDIKELGMIGAGSMGGMMSLLFAEYGIHVHFYDPSQKNASTLLSYAKDTGLEAKITEHDSYKSLCEALDSAAGGSSKPKAFLFSIPHGPIGDTTIDGLIPFLQAGDVIMDASNEDWRRTEARQGRLAPRDVHFVGMGVSGGYQSARHGPSISPGGTRQALDLVFPFLETIAAKDQRGRPCVAKLGPGGCGHYVKMIHNGIEHGMLSALCETWGIMRTGLGMSLDEIGHVFARWNAEGPLRGNFLVDIGSHICQTKTEDGKHVLSNIRDKVVQDVDESEGTGVWSCEEGVRLHVPIPTLAAAHLFRVASADATQRTNIKKVFGGVAGGLPAPGRIDSGAEKKAKTVDDLHAATYAAILMCFVQGLHVLSKANQENHWGLSFVDVLQLWRAGCIIQSDAIVDMLETVYRSPECDVDNLLGHATIAGELVKTSKALKRVVVKALDADLNVPALSASLEYFKYSCATDLPTSFQEAEMDYFGDHMYDLKTELPGKPVKGSHHYEWKPARGILEED